MKTVQFKIYPGTSVNIEAMATIKNNKIISIKILSKIPAGEYAHFYNDASLEAERFLK